MIAVCIRKLQVQAPKSHMVHGHAHWLSQQVYWVQSDSKIRSSTCTGAEKMDGLAGAYGSPAPAGPASPGGRWRGRPKVKKIEKNTVLNMFEHIEHVQTCLLLLSRPLTPLQLLHWRASRSGSCTACDRTTCYTCIPLVAEPSRTSRPPLSAATGHSQRCGIEVRRHRNVARDQLFLCPRCQWSRAPRPRGPCNY